tara:strand:- start:642 stop:830 length:189 start_codon:yes stop_codon:yes gene_type:complete
MNMIVGFYLVMVSMMPNGEIVGETLDYFDNPYDCIEAGNWEESISELGIGFVCIEDVVDVKN